MKHHQLHPPRQHYHFHLEQLYMPWRHPFHHLYHLFPPCYCKVQSINIKTTELQKKNLKDDADGVKQKHALKTLWLENHMIQRLSCMLITCSSNLIIKWHWKLLIYTSSKPEETKALRISPYRPIYVWRPCLYSIVLLIASSLPFKHACICFSRGRLACTHKVGYQR